jgi:hypothetical protein
VFHVSGRVVNIQHSLVVTLRDVRNAGMNDREIRTSTVDASGAFTFRAVPKGTYEITARQGNMRGRTTVEVGARVDGVEVRLEPGADVRLQITAEGDGVTDWNGLGYFLTSDGRSGFTDVPGQTERLVARNVPPGRYTLRLYWPILRTFYVKSAQVGTADVLSDELSVAGSEPVDVRVVLASDGARLSGVVPAPGATVLLMPKGRPRPERVKTATTDQNGRYEITAIAPGEYQLYAWADVDSDVWNDPEFLRKYDKRAYKLVLAANSAANLDTDVLDKQ